MKSDWIDLGPLSEFPAEAPVLRKDDTGRRFACVLRGGEVHALDDRCPHQGYPLSQGALRDGVLTCEWHNWKFELASGACTFGGEPVRRYATRIEGGRVQLEPGRRHRGRGAAPRRRPARGAPARRAGARAARGPPAGRARAPPGARPASAACTSRSRCSRRDGAERAEYGFDHGLALLADLCAWVERGWIPAEEAFVVAAHAIAEPSARLGPRGKGPGRAGARSPLARIADFELDEPAKVSEALAAERRDEAEARMRELVEIARHGRRAPRAHALRRAAPLRLRARRDLPREGARARAERFSSAADEVLAASTVQLAWATADTSLPPFTATRAALARLADLPLPGPDGAAEAARPDAAPLEGAERAAFEAEVLAGEQPAVEATVRWLARGAGPLALLGAIGHAAAVRLARFDSAWEARLDAEVGVLDVTHAVTFAEAAAALGREALPREAAQLAVLAAGFVGKLRKADAAAPHASAAAAARARGGGAAPGGGGARRRRGARDRAGARRRGSPARVRRARPLRRVRRRGEAHLHGARREDARGAGAARVVRSSARRRVPRGAAHPRRPRPAGALRARGLRLWRKKFMSDGRPPDGLY